MPDVQWNSLRKLTVMCLLLSTLEAAGEKRGHVAIAPLPGIVGQAKKAFLANGGGSNLAYDAFYSDIKQWGRFEIVGSPEAADLIIELAYRVEQGGTHVWSSTNAYNGATQVYSRQLVDPQLILTIYDAKTKQSLWSELDHRRLARMEKNREKEMIKSADRLVDDLKTRLSITP